MAKNTVKRRFMIEQAIQFVLSNEGGISTHPADRGGLTKWGITRVFAEDLGFSFNSIQSVSDAEKVYKAAWQRWGMSDLCDINPNVAIVHFDLSVNCGHVAANKLLQRALNAVLPPVDVDGIIGPKTLSALKSVCDNDIKYAHFVIRYNAICVSHYVTIVSKRPSQKVFLNGWLRRQRRRLDLLGFGK